MILELIPTTLRMSTPLGFAALGGIYSERAGVINLGLEGMMLIGAFGYVIGTQSSGSTWFGLLIGIGCGVALALPPCHCNGYFSRGIRLSPGSASTFWR